MRTTIWSYAIGATLSGVVALRAAAGSGHVHPGVDEVSRVAQFCAPAHDDDDVDVNRLYCVKHDDRNPQPQFP
jgi:hypothetical protein